MSDPASPDSIETISTMFFERLENDRGDLIYCLDELWQQIEEQDLKSIFTQLDYIQSRIQGMRTISIVFDGYLDKHEQLKMSLNQNPKEGL